MSIAQDIANFRNVVAKFSQFFFGGVNDTVDPGDGSAPIACLRKVMAGYATPFAAANASAASAAASASSAVGASQAQQSASSFASLAEQQADRAQAAADTFGVVKFFDTKAAATAGIGAIAEGAQFDVYEDETVLGSHTRYHKANGAAVFERVIAPANYGVTVPANYRMLGDIDDTAAIARAEAATGPDGLIYVPRGHEYITTAARDNGYYGEGYVRVNGLLRFLPLEPTSDNLRMRVLSNLGREGMSCSAYTLFGDSLVDCADFRPGLAGHPNSVEVDWLGYEARFLTEKRRPYSYPEIACPRDEALEHNELTFVGTRHVEPGNDYQSIPATGPIGNVFVMEAGSYYQFTDLTGHCEIADAWYMTWPGAGALRITKQAPGGAEVTIKEVATASSGGIGTIEEHIVRVASSPSVPGTIYRWRAIGGRVAGPTSFIRESSDVLTEYPAPLFMRFSMGGAQNSYLANDGNLRNQCLLRHMRRSDYQPRSKIILNVAAGRNDIFGGTDPVTGVNISRTPDQYYDDHCSYFKWWRRAGARLIKTTPLAPRSGDIPPKGRWEDYMAAEEAACKENGVIQNNHNGTDFANSGLTFINDGVHPDPRGTRLRVRKDLYFLSTVDFGVQEQKEFFIDVIYVGTSDLVTGDGAAAIVPFNEVLEDTAADAYDGVAIWSASDHGLYIPFDFELDFTAAVSISGAMPENGNTGVTFEYISTTNGQTSRNFVQSWGLKNGQDDPGKSVQYNLSGGGHGPAYTLVQLRGIVSGTTKSTVYRGTALYNDTRWRVRIKRR